MGKLKGNTAHREKTSPPILGAEFWKKGVSLSGKVVRGFDTRNGVCYEIALLKPVKVKNAAGELEERGLVAVGNMAGFQMALNDAGTESLIPGDTVVISCVGETPSKVPGNSPRVEFAVEIDRRDT